ncbi:MAG: TetR/AcrR family transcriptional regulator [Bacteroidetes bacterium]|nr:TetR/AcrR family transcriptional regulator [Bacteroidota bacterium]
MGISERKLRHKADLKKEILTAARELFTEKGWESTSIRNIAEKIEYSPATIYLYYKDKNEIIFDLHREGFRLLVNYLDVLKGVKNPFERLQAMGRAYIRFALENQDTYKLLFVMEEPMQHVASCATMDWDEGDKAFNLLMNTVQECQKQGHFTNLQTINLSFVIWSTMHGLCTLRTSGHLGHVSLVRNSNHNLDDVLTAAYEEFVKMLEQLNN